MRSKAILPLLVLSLFCSSCAGGGGNDTGTGTDTVPPGEEDFVPPTTDDGQGKPAGATNVSCASADDCGYWHCQCNDGFVVNSADCHNGFCMDAASSCPAACDYFGHEGWSGLAGGGPGADPPEPPASTCGEQSGTSDACWSCVQDQCCGPSAACYDNVDCLSYWDCLADCGAGDFACQSYCADFYPGGFSDYEALGQCVTAGCSAEC